MRRPLWLVLAGMLVPAPGHADGGTLRLSQAEGPFVISVFTAPAPLRVGTADVSVLVQRRAGNAVLLDATVELRTRAPDGTLAVQPASRAQATTGLLHAALLALPSAGRWRLTAVVQHHQSSATVTCDLPVEPEAPRLLEHALPLALPALGISLFALRERLRRKRTRRPVAHGAMMLTAAGTTDGCQQRSGGSAGRPKR
jgi:hypothetical protein